MPTVRDATVDVLRRHRMTTLFANPGSTEITLLSELPDDLRFVLGLHEGSVVGMATGWAISTERPALVVLHTTAGLGNGVGALATARVNRAPLVVLVGQQDRRHRATEPFLTGNLAALGGEYPVSVDEPARAQDVPGAVARAWYVAQDRRGPAIVVVPMDDWLAEASVEPIAAPGTVQRASTVDTAAVTDVAELLADSSAPAIVAGAGADDATSWAALVTLAERLGCPVWQEAFGARAGFPQDHPQFAGHLPSARSRLRASLANHDVVLTVGAPVFRQYPYEPGEFVEPGTRLAVVTDDPEEARRSPVRLAVVGPPAAVCAELARQLPAPSGAATRSYRVDAPPAPPSSSGSLRAAHVLDALAARLPVETVLVEETPSSRPELHARIPAREPLGFLSAAMGGLGFALPAATGVRMGDPGRPVVAVVGDGSALYGIQALWSAAHYRLGVLFVVLANGRYAVLDRLAEQHGDSDPPWPAFAEVRVYGLAQALGCPAQRIETQEELLATLDAVLPELAERTQPLVLDVAVEPDATFSP